MTEILIETLISLFDSVLCIYFITKFIRVPLKNRLFIPTILVYFGTTLIGDFFLNKFSVLNTVSLLVLSCAYALILSAKRPGRAILSACIYKAVYISLSSLIFTVFSLFFEDFDQVITTYSGATARYILLILDKILLVALFRLILILFGSEQSTEIKNGILTLVFTLITILGLGAAMSIAMLPYYYEFRVELLIIILTFAAVNVFLYFMIAQIQKLQQNKYELKLLEEKMRFEEARYNDANAIWSNVRKVQHDMKQHLTVISGYLGEDRIDECERYLHDLMPTVDQIGKLIKSDNRILDYLINSKLCALEDTQVVISGSVGSLSDIKDSDLACLMGNILDNAIEAIENLPEKRIELLFSIQNANRVIICKNTVGHSVLENNRDLKTTKTSGDAHGLGHRIVEKIVSDYHGMVDYFEEFDLFGVQIVLPIPSKEE